LGVAIFERGGNALEGINDHPAPWHQHENGENGHAYFSGALVRSPRVVIETRAM
jgi:hypothetical protein